jgi:flagellar motility protein MotE (MotC chaperone)
MLTSIPVPRLLPTTIAFTAVLLVFKCGVLLDAAMSDGLKPDPAMVGTAHAASDTAGARPGRPVAGGPPPSLPAPKATKVEAPPQTPSSQAQPGSAPVSESERALLQDLRQRRQELDARADALKTRETVLAAAEQKLTVRVGELQALQRKLEVLDAAQKQKEEAGWQGLVKMYEAMKPKDAAIIFNDLSMPVLLQVLNRMKDAKAAAVMAAMTPDKARDVTAELARLRLGHDPAAPDAVASNPPGS